MSQTIELLNRTRRAMCEKLSGYLDSGSLESDMDVRWMRAEICEIDRQLLAQELARIVNGKGYAANGKTLQEQLGADSWLLS